jgi:hypothetical protein
VSGKAVGHINRYAGALPCRTVWGHPCGLCLRQCYEIGRSRHCVHERGNPQTLAFIACCSYIGQGLYPILFKGPIRRDIQGMQRERIEIVSMGTLVPLHLARSTKGQQRPRRTSESSVHSCNQLAGMNGASWYLASKSSAVSFCYSAVGLLESLFEQKARNGAQPSQRVDAMAGSRCRRTASGKTKLPHSPALSAQG